MSIQSLGVALGNGANAPETGGCLDPRLSSNRTLPGIDEELQKMLLISIELIAALPHFHGDPTQGTQIPADITNMMHWMNFLIGQRELVANEVTEQKPDSVKLVTRVVCGRCRRDARDELAIRSSEALSPLPIWRPQLEFLLTFTRTVGMELFARGCPSSTLRRFPNCLAKLMAALLRQRQILRSLREGETDIEVDQCSADTCARCGQPVDAYKDVVP